MTSKLSFPLTISLGIQNLIKQSTSLKISSMHDFTEIKEGDNVMKQEGAGADWESRNLLPVSSQPPADCMYDWRYQPLVSQLQCEADPQGDSRSSDGLSVPLYGPLLPSLKSLLPSDRSQCSATVMPSLERWKG